MTSRKKLKRLREVQERLDRAREERDHLWGVHANHVNVATLTQEREKVIKEIIAAHPVEEKR